MSGLAKRLAFVLDESYDRDYSSDGVSRYGAYLRQRRDMFDAGDGPTANRCSFAVSAWQIAQSPIMAPGYVRLHPRVLATDDYWDDDGRLALAVRIVAPLPAAVGRAIDRWRWRGWAQCGYDDPRWVEPLENDCSAAYAVVVLRVPVAPGALPTPRYRSGAADTATAKRAVRAVCAVLNDQIDPVLAELDACG